MVFMVYGNILMGRGHGRRWDGWFDNLITKILGKVCYLQYYNFLGLSDKKLVIVCVVIPVHGSEKQRSSKLFAYSL